MSDGVFRPVPEWYRDDKDKLRDAEDAEVCAARGGIQSDVTRPDVEKLFMITEALWNILKEKHGYADEDLARMVQDIDLRDGKLDGKVTRQANPPCAQCGRTLMGGHPVCLYCGAVSVRGPFER
ncbi:MAG: hypothetical protein QGG42_13875 [Phycisphaerae bacterium]|jgi:ribosomal protein S27AE|nr:hypothetical protein [Phycisphaerae bacterium]